MEILLSLMAVELVRCPLLTENHEPKTEYAFVPHGLANSSIGQDSLYRMACCLERRYLHCIDSTVYSLH